MNRIQRENHKTGSYKIKKLSLSFFDDKIYILRYRFDALAPNSQ